jgi:hypothetical protein
MAEVHAELKFVRNLGDFESVHVTAGITDTVRPGEKAGEAWERCWALVEAKVDSKVAEIDKELGKK